MKSFKITSKKYLAEIITKPLTGGQFQFLASKLVRPIILKDPTDSREH